MNNRITDSEIEISPPNVCTEIMGWCNSSTVPRAFTQGGNACYLASVLESHSGPLKWHHCLQLLFALNRGCLLKAPKSFDEALKE